MTLFHRPLLSPRTLDEFTIEAWVQPVGAVGPPLTVLSSSLLGIGLAHDRRVVVWIRTAVQPAHSADIEVRGVTSALCCAHFSCISVLSAMLQWWLPTFPQDVPSNYSVVLSDVVVSSARLTHIALTFRKYHYYLYVDGRLAGKNITSLHHQSEDSLTPFLIGADLVPAGV